MDDKRRLSMCIDVYAHSAGRGVRDLNQRCVDSKRPEDTDGFASARIVADCADHRDTGTLHRCMAGEVCRRAAESRAFRKKVPEHFTD